MLNNANQLFIYNSLTRQKEMFKPMVPGRVAMYVCGITVYDYCHIGHARSMIIFDVIARYFRHLGFELNYVRNITDIDDKIIQRAKEQDEPWADLTKRFIQVMKEDEISLGILPTDQEPKATDCVTEMLALIARLIDEGAAYVASNQDVYFSVRHFATYGKLSQRNIEELQAGARVDVGESKRDPLDFVLWKAAKPGEPAWDSPYGPGRPGWHIECSAMATTRLGKTFDIHGGGLDLKFPHHENEIAQSEAAYHQPFARYWMHAGLLQVNHEKMSKSLGNFFTIRDVLKKYSAEQVRYFMLSGHYRSPVNYSEENLAQAQNALTTLYGALRDLPWALPLEQDPLIQAFHDAMNDDFNFPIALGVLFEIAHQINRLRQAGDLNKAAAYGATLRSLGLILGLLQDDPDSFFCGNLTDAEINQIQQLIDARLAAKRQKAWQEADALRDQLTALGVIIEDHAQGTSWRKKT
jgi:cysteinyl-tRNA synthetase